MYLKYVYDNYTISSDTKWPPTPGREFITLAVVEHHQKCRDEYIGYTLQGDIKEIIQNREISIEQIFEPVIGQKKLKLVLIEGAPGIGKSALSWELCRKWDELSCMQQYSLVILLRLREEEVQEIKSIHDLFCQYESEDKNPLVKEVSKSQGNGILFILDGFDELPKTLQKKSFLLNLMRGQILPACSVLVTSRPSVTAELLTSCQPQKRIQVLGFTQESVEAYASSIFSSDPEKVKKFMDYISASQNPAINSLMYIPLNAAIIVQIYLDCKSDTLLPHTLTDLYTLLCLTILNRDLKFHVEKFEDLPADLHEQFLHLSQIAFEGILHENIIFHNLPPDLVHFGFLDAVSTLYGGGKVSYNFLHLTLQEFFAAYHISHLSSSGLEVFKKHCKDERWNVVWRFVAGIMKFKYYEGHMDSSIFIKSGDPEASISLFTIQCLFEAHTIDHFSSILPAKARIDAWNNCTALDTYAIGFCISNFHVNASWSVHLNNNWKPFVCGLNGTLAGANLSELLVLSCSVHPAELKVVVQHSNLTRLAFYDCSLDLICHSKLIPHMKNLVELCICDNNVTDGDQDGLLKIMQQLPRSKVTSLNIVNTGIYRLLRESPHDYSSSLKKLVCPSSGKLFSLHVGDIDDYDDGRLASIVSAPSSLKYLELCNPDLSKHVFYWKKNNNLTRLKLTHFDSSEQNVQIIVEISQCKYSIELDCTKDSKKDIITCHKALNLEFFSGSIGDF